MEPGSGAGTGAGAWSGPDLAGRRRRRWRALAAGLAAVLLVAGMAAVAGRLARRAADWPLEGRIRVGASWRRSLRFALGDFRVDWDGRTGSLAVWNRRMPGHLVWATPPGQAFFFGAAGTMRSRDTIGYLTLWRRTLAVYGEQTVDGIAAGSGQLRFTGELRSVDGSAVRYTFTLRAAAPDRLEYEGRVGPAAAGAPPVTRLYLDWKALPGERFYGFGVQYSVLDMRGRVVPILVQEHGIGRGMQPLTLLADLTHGAGGSWWNTYAPVPYFLSSAMQSMFSANGQFQRFNLTEPGLGQLEVEAPAIRGAIFAGRTPAELLRAYTAVAGRMRPLPAWTQEGFLFGAEGGTAAVRARLERLLAAGVPVTGLWLQDWVGQRTTSFGQQLVWNWRLDARQYPGWAAFVRELRAKGIRVLGYVNPFLVPAGRGGLYREAAARGYFVRGADGRPLLFPYPGFRAALIDLTNPAARAWLERVMVRELVGNGFSGWMADFGEELPLDARLADGRTGATLHNLYPVLWAQLNRQVLERAGLAGEGLVFLRSGFTTSPGVAPDFWLGDQLQSWDGENGLASAVKALVSAGLSGFALESSDIGGYTAITQFSFRYARDEELLMRWMEFDAFTTLFRSHEGNQPARSAQVDSSPRLVAQLRRFAILFRDLAPYREALMQEAASTGAPVDRALFFDDPEDPVAYQVADREFLLGPDVLVAPVTAPGTERLRVYLPRGRWVHVWSGRVYDAAGASTGGGTAAGAGDGGGAVGRWVTVATPVGQPAVFYRQGAAVASLFRKALAETGAATAGTAGAAVRAGGAARPVFHLVAQR